MKGVQKTTWTADHQPALHCDSSYRGSGREKVMFRSRRAVVVRAFKIGSRTGGHVTFAGSGGSPDLPTRGSVSRSAR